VLPSVRKGRLNTVQRHYGPDGLRRNCAARQVPHAHHVVGRAGKREDPIDFQRSAIERWLREAAVANGTKANYWTMNGPRNGLCRAAAKARMNRSGFALKLPKPKRWVRF
jgi:hypothetical protein